MPNRSDGSAEAQRPATPGATSPLQRHPGATHDSGDPPPTPRTMDEQLAELIEWSKQNHGDIEQLRLGLRSHGDFVSSQFSLIRANQGHLTDALLPLPAEVASLRTVTEENGKETRGKLAALTEEQMHLRRGQKNLQESIDAQGLMLNEVPKLHHKMDMALDAISALHRRSLADVEHEVDQQLRLKDHSVRVAAAEKETGEIKRKLSDRQLVAGGGVAALLSTVIIEIIKHLSR